MEAAFEEWFQAERRRTFDLSKFPGERIEDHPDWSMGFRDAYLKGWMGATLWCRLCKREHEGKCFEPTSGAEQCSLST